MSLACQHFSFDTKKLLDSERPFSPAFAGFVPLTSRALSHTCGHLRVSRILLNTLRKKRLHVV